MLLALSNCEFFRSAMDIQKLSDQLLERAANAATPPQEASELVNLSRTLLEGAKFQSEANKLRSEQENLVATRKAEERRFLISVVAPTVSTIALAATLLLQIYQTHQKTIDDQNTHETAAYKAAMSD